MNSHTHSPAAPAAINELITWPYKSHIHYQADLIEKLLRTAQNVLELSQFEEVLLQGFLIGVYFLQLVF